LLVPFGICIAFLGCITMKKDVMSKYVEFYV